MCKLGDAEGLMNNPRASLFQSRWESADKSLPQGSEAEVQSEWSSETE